MENKQKKKIKYLNTYARGIYNNDNDTCYIILYMTDHCRGRGKRNTLLCCTNKCVKRSNPTTNEVYYRLFGKFSKFRRQTRDDDSSNHVFQLHSHWKPFDRTLIYMVTNMVTDV